VLTLTEDAAGAIQGLVGDRPGVGLRIFSRSEDGGEPRFGLALTDAPEPTDEVVEQSGCQVFLDAQIAPLVDGQTLDAHRTEGDKVRFRFVA
jgi:Fe-S cluster assembly iron-binding protein IscA